MQAIFETRKNSEELYDEVKALKTLGILWCYGDDKEKAYALAKLCSPTQMKDQERRSTLSDNIAKSEFSQIDESHCICSTENNLKEIICMLIYFASQFTTCQAMLTEQPEFTPSQDDLLFTDLINMVEGVEESSFVHALLLGIPDDEDE